MPSARFSAGDLCSVLTDLHFDREAAEGDTDDPSKLADVIRHQIYQISMVKSFLGEQKVGDLEYESVRLNADYARIVDNYEGLRVPRN